MGTNRKVLYSVILFFVVLVFGILAPDPDTRDEVSTTEKKIETTATPIQTTEPVTEVVNDAVTEETSEAITEATTEIVEEKLDTEALYGVDYSTYEELEAIISSMSIEEKVGQMFFIKNDGRFTSEILEEYPMGGMILFKGDLKGKSVVMLNDYLTAFQNDTDIPMLIGTDEEGGSVIRFSSYPTFVDEPYESPRTLYAQGGYDLIETDTISKSQTLLSYGVNVNFAPVCDVSLNPGEYMYSRAFGDTVDETCTYVDLVVSTMKQENMGSVLKHFPGYGGNGDTHKNIIHDTRSLEQFQTVDLLPFKSGIDAGADCVLVSHNIVECMDSEWPASLSGEVHRVLREDLGFKGVIITDDLMMSGVSSYASNEESAVQAVLAGNDMILSTDYQVQYQAVVDAVKVGTISEELVDEAVLRVLIWKKNLGLM